MSQNLLQWGPIDKQSSNANLLRILTKRKAQSVTQLNKKDWPGKLPPSFAVNRIKTSKDNNFISNSSSKIKQSRMKNKVQSVKLLRNIPIAKMGSISLSIQPTSRSKTILMNTTWKTNFTQNSRLDLGKTPETRGRRRLTRDQIVSGYQNLQSYKSQNKQQTPITPFQNNRLNTAMSRNKNKNQDIFQNRNTNNMMPIKITNNQQEYKNESKEIEQIKSHIIQSFQFQKQSKGLERKKSIIRQDPLNNYVIDYSAFNYVDKIVDNPEKWMKYVKKKVTPVQSQHLKQENCKIPKANDQFLTGIN